MRLLYVIPSYEAAALGNKIHSELIDAWRSHGITADVLTISARLRAPTVETIDGVRVHRLAGGPRWQRAGGGLLQRWLGYPYLPALISGMRDFARRHGRDYDLLHVETAFPMGYAVLQAQRGLPPAAVSLAGADMMGVPEYDYGYGRYRLVRPLLRQVMQGTALVRPTSPQIEQLALRYGAVPARTLMVPYNITRESFPPADQPLEAWRAAQRAAVAARHGLDVTRPIIVSLNRLHPFKGIQYLVDALPQLRDAGVAAQLLIVGPNRTSAQFGDMGRLLTERASALGVSELVTLTGAIPQAQAASYLAAADSAVVPSVHESFSRVVIESCAVGTPPVVTETTGASYYVRQAQAGAVVAPRSGTALAEGLLAVFSERAAWQAMSRRATELAPRFGTPAIAAALAARYRTVAAAQPVRA
jgi:glycosyltransferase involved in cell wall biosynthesis